MLPHSANPFANSPLDRAGHRRKDAAWLAEAGRDPRARFIPFNAGKPAMRGQAPCWLSPQEIGAASSQIFLGVDAEGAARFACAMETAPGGEFTEMRAAAAHLSGADIAMLGCARALLEWHARHGFCANCGAASAMTDAGWKRECAACNAEHFPRVDPVVIMLVVRGDNCLLGRQTRFTAAMYSALAGYVEPGETIEEACAREVLEEAGVRVKNVRYHSTQPWPFPSSLMIGLIAETADETLKIDRDELEDARWFTREETRALLERRHSEFRAPPPIAIAHHLMKAWAYS